MKYQLSIKSNEGYGADQVRGITVGELKEMIEYLEDDAEIITYDHNNPMGASYGRILLDCEEVEEEPDDIEEFIARRNGN